LNSAVFSSFLKADSDRVKSVSLAGRSFHAAGLSTAMFLSP